MDGWRSWLAQWSYKPKVVGSNPTPSTMRKQNKTLTCPECRGEGRLKIEPRAVMPGAPDLSFEQACYYCAGTGYQSDEDDSYEQFKGRE